MTAPTPGSILVIDDESSIVRGLTRLLHRDGYRVTTASNGRDALAQLQGQCYDVILSDLRMPELDGRAFYALLRQHSPALGARVIFLTGVSDEAENQAFLAQCGQPWLRKPYPIAALRSAIQQIVGGASPAQSADTAGPARPARSQQRSRKCQAQRQRRQARSEAVQRWCARSGKVRMYDRPEPA
jgi:CheY-like chemotaxis protein